jgi:Competence protein
MAVVAGVVFFFLRALLALIPGVADRMPIKKWAAFAALVVTAFYVVLSGAEVATQRSFIIIAIVLVGVMLDRPILTLRTVTIAALWSFSLRRKRSCIRVSRCDLRRRWHSSPRTAAGWPGRDRESTRRSALARRFGA